ncbi:MAG: squalene synthase HpnC [Terriglobia bacterium]
MGFDYHNQTKAHGQENADRGYHYHSPGQMIFNFGGTLVSHWTRGIYNEIVAIERSLNANLIEGIVRSQAARMKNQQQRLRDAYARCREISRRHYENFPTASLLVPRDKRDVLAAIYAFARAADDFADEPGDKLNMQQRPITAGDRLAAIAGWRKQLQECFEQPPENIEHPVFLALGDSVRRYGLSFENLDNLLQAFEQDVRMNRHPNFASLLSYSSRSANPVGRLVLELFGYHDAALFALSDSICTALQLANFWQDVAVDLARDRIYLPIEDLAQFGLSVDDLKCFLAAGRPLAKESWKRLMVFEIARTSELFECGRPLPERVGRELRRQLRLTWLGGAAILEKIQAVDYDVFQRRPTLTAPDFLKLYVRSWRKPPAQAGAFEAKQPVV